jgi:two-component system chemotaxis response regulator CheV
MKSKERLLQPGSNQFELLEFTLRELLPDGRVYDGLYGINVYKVQQVIPWPTCVHLPGCPPVVEGAFLHRGEQIPLVDLRKALGLHPAPPGQDRMVIVSEFNRVRVGLAIDTANRIHRLTWADLHSPPETQRDTLYRDLVGLIHLRGSVIRVLNIEHVLARVGMGEKAYVKPAATQPETAWDGAGRLVLVVDDSALMRGMIMRLCETANLKSLPCRDGQEAWDKLEQLALTARQQGSTLRDLIPVAIVDIEMPRMDGFTLVRKLRQNSEAHGLKIILHTSLGGTENTQKGEQVGADAFVVKFDGPLLLGTVRRLLGQ